MVRAMRYSVFRDARLLLMRPTVVSPSIASREGVMLVRDDPATALLAQPDGQP
jgi:hypothetical protein